MARFHEIEFDRGTFSEYSGPWRETVREALRSHSVYMARYMENVLGFEFDVGYSRYYGQARAGVLRARETLTRLGAAYLIPPMTSVWVHRGRSFVVGLPDPETFDPLIERKKMRANR